MKFSVPFFGRRPAQEQAAEAGSTEEKSPPSPAAGLSDKKPFIVPASADAMPSFSQPVEQVDLAGVVATPASMSQAVQKDAAETVITAVEVPKQMESMVMSQEDIIAAYKIFLKRHPESMDVVQSRVGLSGDRILVDFLSSSEFTSRPEVVQLIYALAKKLLEEQKAKAALSPAPAAESVSEPTPKPATTAA